MEKIGVDYSRSDYTQHNFYNYDLVLFEGVKIRISDIPERLIKCDLPDEDIEKLDNLHSMPLIRFSMDDLYNISLKILNEYPKLRGNTLLGWDDHSDLSKDPNYYCGEYIFPDGNTYTIVKKNDSVHVYPCGGDYCLMMNKKKLPLIEYNICTQKWANRIIDKENSELITISSLPDKKKY